MLASNLILDRWEKCNINGVRRDGTIYNDI